MRGSQNWGYHHGGAYNKDYHILGSILGSPCVGKLPNLITQLQLFKVVMVVVVMVVVVVVAIVVVVSGALSG